MNSKGQSIAEILIAMAVGMIVSLTMATVFAFGVQQFNILVDQNLAEESLLQSAYLLKNYLSQTVKISCRDGDGTGANPIQPGLNMAGFADTSPPYNIMRGIIDCNPGGASGRMIPPVGTNLPGLAVHRWTQNVKNPFAVFIRDMGGALNAAGGLTTGFGGQAGANSGASKYMTTGIYFTPPGDGSIGAAPKGMSGVLYFVQSTTAGSINTLNGAPYDHMVDIGVVQNTVTNVTPITGGTVFPYNVSNLEAVQIRLVARYINDPGIGNNTYEPNPGVPVGARDIEMTIPITFRNSFLGVSSTGTGTAERSFGGIYFFRFTSPPMGSFDF